VLPSVNSWRGTAFPLQKQRTPLRSPVGPTPRTLQARAQIASRYAVRNRKSARGIERFVERPHPQLLMVVREDGGVRVRSGGRWPAIPRPSSEPHSRRSVDSSVLKHRFRPFGSILFSNRPVFFWSSFFLEQQLPARHCRPAATPHPGKTSCLSKRCHRFQFAESKGITKMLETGNVRPKPSGSTNSTRTQTFRSESGED
jgi:hypothetical protein